MNIEMVDKETSDRLEELSLERDKSKASVALELCEFFFGPGVPHRESGEKRLKRATAARQEFLRQRVYPT